MFGINDFNKHHLNLILWLNIFVDIISSGAKQIIECVDAVFSAFLIYFLFGNTLKSQTSVLTLFYTCAQSS